MNVDQEILRLERDALERWGRGDPGGYLELSAPDVVYFDPFLERALVGREALARYYEALRGQVRLHRFDLLHARVQAHGDTAVLTFRLDAWRHEAEVLRWNATEVYRRAGDEWRIVHTHWAFTGAGSGA